MPGEISFVLHGSLFEHEFYFVLGTNRKQTTCTNKFSMCLWRQQFDLAEAVVTFFLVSKDTQHEMHALSRIFHLKAQNEPSLVQTRVKAKDRKQAQTLLFPSVRWSKSWNLRDGLCV